MSLHRLEGVDLLLLHVLEREREAGGSIAAEELYGRQRRVRQAEGDTGRKVDLALLGVVGGLEHDHGLAVRASHQSSLTHSIGRGFGVTVEEAT